MFKRIVSTILTLLLLAALAPAVLAAELPSVDDPQVFIKQSRSSGTCTLASAAMMLRRAAILSGDESWAQITEDSCRAAFWQGGLPYEFSYGDMTVGHGWLPGGDANREALAGILAQHPEGVVILSYSAHHGILLTDCTDGVFYCADPAPSIPGGRMPIDQAWGTRVENSAAYWYLTSPIQAVPWQEQEPLTLTETAPRPEDASENILSVTQHMGLEDETAGPVLQ